MRERILWALYGLAVYVATFAFLELEETTDGP